MLPEVKVLYGKSMGFSGIFGHPSLLGKLAVNSRCCSFRIGVFVCFKNKGERKTEIPLTNFKTSSFIWKSFQLMQCVTSQNSQNISVTVNKRSVYTLVFNYRYAKMYTWSIQSFHCRASSALAQWSLRTQAIFCMKYRSRMKGYFDHSGHCWSMFTAMQYNG